MYLKLSKESILKDIKSLGITFGDTLFVTADLLAVGYFFRSRTETLNAWVEILLEAVGSEGTVIVAAYTDSFIRFSKDRKCIFERNSTTTSGSLSAAFLLDPRSVRSRHPTNSCVGIGPNAHKILDDHDQASMSYSLIGRVIELGGKNLMIGTVDKKNAPMAFHYAQECLGQTLHHPLSGFFQTYYKDEFGATRLFTSRDCGGCSRGAYNLYGHLIVNSAVDIGYIGKARSAIIDGKKSFDLITNTLRTNPRLVLCDNRYCLSCYGRWNNNGLRVIWFYINKYMLQELLKTASLLVKTRKS